MPVSRQASPTPKTRRRPLARCLAIAGLASAGLLAGCATSKPPAAATATVGPAATPSAELGEPVVARLPESGAIESDTVIVAEQPDFVVPTERPNVPPPDPTYVNPPIEQRYLYTWSPASDMDPSVIDPTMDEDIRIVDPVGEDAKRSFIRGALNYQQGVSDKALASYLDAVKKDPENFWIKNRAAMAALENNDLRTAEKLAKEVLAAEPKNTTAMMILATHALIRDDLATGTQWLENILAEQPRNLQALVMMARLAAEQERDPEKTKIYCARILETTSRNLEALMWYAEANALTGEVQDAADLYKQVVRYRPGLIMRLVEMAERLEAQNRPADALELLRQGVLMQPSNEMLRLRWETALEEQAGAEAVLDAYRQLAIDHPLDLSLQELVAGYYARTRRLDDLRTQRQRMLEIDPRHIPSLLSLGRVALEQDDMATASEFFEKAIAAGPTQASVYRDIALVYLAQDNIERASQLLEEAALFDPGDAETVLAMASLAEQQKDPKRTEQLLKRAIDLLPGNGRMLKMLGDFYRREDRFELASQLYEQAIATDPGDFQGQVVLAILYMELGNEKGLDLLQTSAPRGLSNDEPFFSTYGALALEFGYWERALWAFQKAIGENKVDIRHKMGRARALLHLGRPDEAFGGLRAAIDELPADNQARRVPVMSLASLLEEVGRRDEAVAELEKLAAGSRDDFDVRSTYVETLAQAGRNEDADRELASLAADLGAANDEETRMLRARVLRYRGDFEGALAILQPMLDAAPDSVRVRFEMAITYSEMKDLENTERAYRHIIDHAGDAPEHEGLVLNAYNNLAYTWAVANTRLDEAEKLAAEALDRAPRADYVLDTMGWVKFRQGDMDEAEKYLEESARLSLGDPEIFENLGDLYRATARPAEALEQYQRALAWPSVDDELRARVQAKATELEASLPSAPAQPATTTSASTTP